MLGILNEQRLAMREEVEQHRPFFPVHTIAAMITSKHPPKSPDIRRIPSAEVGSAVVVAPSVVVIEESLC